MESTNFRRVLWVLNEYMKHEIILIEQDVSKLDESDPAVGYQNVRRETYEEVRNILNGLTEVF